MADERVCIIGARGMLGHDLMSAFGERAAPQPAALWGLDKEEIDITDEVQSHAVLAELQPTLIVNAAAFTDVDACESQEPAAARVNGDGPGHLARFCREHRCRLIHVSTDFVFDGEKRTPYLPEDPMNPLSAYGRTKAEGERQVRETMPEAVIVRTSWLFGEMGRNFVKTIQRLAAERNELSVVNDQVGCPTYSRDLAGGLLCLSERLCQGVYHYCNADACSWYDFAVEIIRQCGLGTSVKPIGSGDLDRPARRPAYSVLDTGRFAAETGIQPRSWREALGDCLDRLGRDHKGA